MKFPKAFIPRKFQKNSKKLYLTLDDFLVIERFCGHYYHRKTYNLHSGSMVVDKLGIDSRLMNKGIDIWYDSIDRYVVLEYKSEGALISNLPSIFEEGIVSYYDSDIKVTERCLAKDKILIVAHQIREKFFKSTADYYRRLGFKHLDYELKFV